MQQFSEIEKQRAEHGIEQKALAERAGLKKQTYTRLKRPSPRGPSERTLQRLSDALAAIIEEKGKGHG